MEQRMDDERDMHESDDEARARSGETPETSDEATDAGAGAGAPSTASMLHGDGEDARERDEPEPQGSEGADEQLTVPEDRDAAAAADGRPAPPHSANGEERPFELFEGSDMDTYRHRWDALQASFVDDPRAAAEQADALVGELVERVTQRHRQLHDEVGDTADGGDTEAMRLALRRYRVFYQALVGERT
jgi:hypothetical protein